MQQSPTKTLFDNETIKLSAELSKHETSHLLEISFINICQRLQMEQPLKAELQELAEKLVTLWAKLTRKLRADDWHKDLARRERKQPPPQKKKQTHIIIITSWHMLQLSQSTSDSLRFLAADSGTHHPYFAIWLPGQAINGSIDRQIDIDVDIPQLPLQARCTGATGRRRRKWVPTWRWKDKASNGKHGQARETVSVVGGLTAREVRRGRVWLGERLGEDIATFPKLREREREGGFVTHICDARDS